MGVCAFMAGTQQSETVLCLKWKRRFLKKRSSPALLSKLLPRSKRARLFLTLPLPKRSFFPHPFGIRGLHSSGKWLEGPLISGDIVSNGLRPFPLPLESTLAPAH